MRWRGWNRDLQEAQELEQTPGEEPSRQMDRPDWALKGMHSRKREEAVVAGWGEQDGEK